MNSTTATADSATTSVRIDDPVPRPPSRTLTTGRYTAIERSSISRTDRITGTSGRPTHPRSDRSLATTPDELTYVTPPSSTLPTGPNPSTSPATTPGRKFAARLTSPTGAARGRLCTSSSAEY